MTREEAARLFNEMAKNADATIEVTVGRTAEAQDRDGMGVSLSPEAMGDINLQVMTWVGTRMLRYQEETGLAPQNVKVTVTAEVLA